MSASVLVIGAGGGIGAALCDKWLSEGYSVMAVSRAPMTNPKVSSLQCDGSAAGIKQCVDTFLSKQLHFRFICIATGVLHDELASPEKRIADVNEDVFEHTMRINALLPLMWLKGLEPLITGKQPVTIAALSARVGSISDNQLGGWYSYRTSKAALNMLLKTANIELYRRNKQCKLIAYHPGTVDTGLSKPFQANVPKNKLFSPAFTAEKLVEIMHSCDPDGQLSYLDWQGKTIPF